jgi:hypothetical protein
VHLLHDLADPVPAQRPQHRHTLDRGEHQVEPGDRLAGLAQLVGDVLAHCLRRRRGPVPGGQQLGRDALLDGPALLHARAPLVGLLELLVGAADRPDERDVGLGVLVEPPPEPGRLHRLAVGHPGGDPGGDQRVRVRVQALPEQREHVLLGDLAGHAERGHPGPDPRPRRVAGRGVVVDQRVPR